jgi:hypothetical protein
MSYERTDAWWSPGCRGMRLGPQPTLKLIAKGAPTGVHRPRTVAARPPRSAIQAPNIDVSITGWRRATRSVQIRTGGSHVTSHAGPAAGRAARGRRRRGGGDCWHRHGAERGSPRGEGQRHPCREGQRHGLSCAGTGCFGRAGAAIEPRFGSSWRTSDARLLRPSRHRTMPACPGGPRGSAPRQIGQSLASPGSDPGGASLRSVHARAGCRGRG